MHPSDRDMHEIIFRVETKWRSIQKHANERDEDFKRRKERHLDNIIWQELQAFYKGVADGIEVMFRKIKEHFSGYLHI